MHENCAETLERRVLNAMQAKAALSERKFMHPNRAVSYKLKVKPNLKTTPQLIKRSYYMLNSLFIIALKQYKQLCGMLRFILGHMRKEL